MTISYFLFTRRLQNVTPEGRCDSIVQLINTLLSPSEFKIPVLMQSIGRAEHPVLINYASMLRENRNQLAKQESRERWRQGMDLTACSSKNERTTSDFPA
jgi:hypothetical protein